MEKNDKIKNQRQPPIPVPFHYAWIVVALTFLTTLTGSGVRSSAQVFIKPFEAEFGWNRPAISSAVGLNLFLIGAVSPISGWFFDTFGPRRVMLGTLTLLGVGVAGTLVMQELWQLILLWGIVVGIGASGVSSILSASVTFRWFSARRGLVLGILNGAGSTGQLVFIPLLMFAVINADWRTGSWIMIGSCTALILLDWFLMRDNPPEVGLEHYTEENTMAPPKRNESIHADTKIPHETSVLDAMKTSTFWLLSAGYFVCGGTTNGLIGTHLIPHALERGIPAVTTASIYGVMGFMNFVGTLSAGWLTDRIDARKVLALVYALRGVSLFILPFVNGKWGLLIFGIFYGLDWFATVPPVVALTGDTFGKQSIGRIYGWIFLAHQVGGAFSAIGAGLIFAWLGDYKLAFLSGGVMAILATVMSLSIKSHNPANSNTPQAPGLTAA